MNILKTPDQKRWSRKNITWALCLSLVVISVIRGGISANWPPEYIFTGLLTLIGFLLGVAEAGKKFMNKNEDEAKP